jgi:peptidoglycan/LPS O-acetylase OafA/YrhL
LQDYPLSRAVSANASLPYLPHVDGLRAVAVALVVIFHAWPSALPGGFIGVDIFFVISGFIITRQLAQEMKEGRFSFLAFLGRRVRRLVPAAFVCCALVSIVAVLLLMPEALSAYSESLVATWTMTANFYFFQNTGYFDASSAEAPLLHMWSLAVEDQFYLTWPLLLLLMYRKLGSRSRIVLAVLLLAVLSLAHSEFAARSNPSLAFFLPFSRAFELLAGCMLAIGAPLMSAPGARVLAALDTIGLLLVAGSVLALHEGVPFPGFAVAPAIIGTVLLIAGGLTGPTPVSRLLSLRPVVVVGLMSYSIYLYHWPLIAFATYRLGRPPDASEAAMLVAAGFLLGALSWLLIEQKLTRRLGLYELQPSGILKGLVAASAALCAFAGATVAAHGWPQRLDNVAYNVYKAASTGNPMRKSCDGYDQAFANNSRCTFGKPLAEGASYDVAVFGDSNGDHFVPMIAKLATDAGLSGRQVTQSACASLIGGTRLTTRKNLPSSDETCTRYQETIIAFLDRNPGLKLAVLSSAWNGYDITKPNRLTPSGFTGKTIPFSVLAAETISIFRKRGIEVLVIGQIPFMDTFSMACYVDAARRDTEKVDCTEPRAEIESELNITQKAFHDLAALDKDVTFFSILDLLCDDKFCSAFKDDQLLYRNNGHLNALGAAYLARYAKLPELNPTPVTTQH